MDHEVSGQIFVFRFLSFENLETNNIQKYDIMFFIHFLSKRNGSHVYDNSTISLQLSLCVILYSLSISAYTYSVQEEAFVWILQHYAVNTIPADTLAN